MQRLAVRMASNAPPPPAPSRDDDSVIQTVEHTVNYELWIVVVVSRRCEPPGRHLITIALATAAFRSSLLDGLTAA